MIHVGLTGGVASGKSAVAAQLAKLGAVVIDADKLAREVVAPGTDGLAQIRQAFGQAVLTLTVRWTGRPSVRWSSATRRND